MPELANYLVKIHATKDKKKLKDGIREYEYGTINIRDPQLRQYIGKIVKISVRSV